MIPKSFEYIERAVKAERAALVVDDPHTRAVLEQIAASWRRVASTFQQVEDIVRTFNEEDMVSNAHAGLPIAPNDSPSETALAET
jgi:hypothetical protein